MAVSLYAQILCHDHRFGVYHERNDQNPGGLEIVLFLVEHLLAPEHIHLRLAHGRLDLADNEGAVLDNQIELHLVQPAKDHAVMIVILIPLNLTACCSSM